MEYDLIITGGTVVDGTGLPRRRADVGISSGRILAVGQLGSSLARRRIDAEGHIVCPGIIDVHTHYDPQVCFDPYATSSSYHGVTTVVAGNCGFSIAPCRSSDREFIARMFARVEGMSPAALEGVDWDFETFPEYLDRRRGRLGVNLACYLGHSSIRRWAMGPEASERAALEREVDAMCALVNEAIRAGAAGLSSSHSPTQLDGDQRPVPSRLATRSELVALAQASSGGGSLSYLPETVVDGIGENDHALLVELALASRQPVIVQGLGARSKVDPPLAGDWETSKSRLNRAMSQGAAVFSLLRTQPYNRPFNLATGTHMYDGVPAWREFMFLPIEEKRRLLEDTSHRDRLRWAVDTPNRDPALGSTKLPPPWADVFVSKAGRPKNADWVGRSVLEIADETGVAPADAMLDLALAEDFTTEFCWASDNEDWAEAVRERQHDPHMIIGVSDGGAHLDQDDGSEWSTYFLQSWVLSRKAWTLEEGVRQITQVPAALCGFSDRGALLPGLAADIMIFDPETIGLRSKSIIHDFPNGEPRFAARPGGIKATIVNGWPIIVDGQLTGDLPGQIVRPGTDVGDQG